MATPERGTAPKPFVFVIMPFDKTFDDIYEFGIKGAAADASAYAERTSEQMFDDSILDRVVNQISKADVVVADMTGRNPNVYYEAGMAAAWGKAWIVIAQANQDLTFDVEQVRFILYANRIGAAEQFEDRLRRAIEETLGNPKRAKNE